MHITFLADPLDNQQEGVHFYTKNLIKNLLKIDQENQYSFIHLKNNDFFNNTDHHIIPTNKTIPGYDTYRKFIKIPQKVKQINPDIVIETCHIGPFNIPKKIKRVVIVHDLTPILFPEFHTKQGVWGHRLLLGRSLKNADAILTVSNTTKQDIIKKYNPPCPIKVIYQGINMSESVESNIKLPKPYILCIGTIEPRKNLNILIDAFNELKKEKKIPHKLILVGGIGWKSKHLIKKIERNNDVILKGYIPESQKNNYYQNADFFVYPSIYEGFGIPPLEAMHNGIPVICSTGGSLNEIYQNYALMFKPDNKEKLKKHILNLSTSPILKEKLSSAGKIYSKNFNWTNTAEKTIGLLKNIHSPIS